MYLSLYSIVVQVFVSFISCNKDSSKLDSHSLVKKQINRPTNTLSFVLLKFSFKAFQMSDEMRHESEIHITANIRRIDD